MFRQDAVDGCPVFRQHQYNRQTPSVEGDGFTSLRDRLRKTMLMHRYPLQALILGRVRSSPGRLLQCSAHYAGNLSLVGM
eukprot:m.297245 g.297245  ORF g.297245 m.297245 type:complete len:80 (+) comp19526_c1_seq8:489-728(+)